MVCFVLLGWQALNKIKRTQTNRQKQSLASWPFDRSQTGEKQSFVLDIPRKQKAKQKKEQKQNKTKPKQTKTKNKQNKDKQKQTQKTKKQEQSNKQRGSDDAHLIAKA